jgi:hypothetical protein
MLVAALALATQVPTAEPIVWEKLIAPGVTYRMEVLPGPLIVHAVRVTPEAEGVLVAGELADGRVFDVESATKGRETITEMAARTHALVAVNADFFPFTGDPLGAMVRDGELVSSPQHGRASFCWGKGFTQVAYLTFSATLGYQGQSVPIFGVNQECGDNMVVLNTPAARYATSREPATHAVCVLADPVHPQGEWKPVVRRIVRDETSVRINDDEVVLTYRGTPSEKLTFLSSGDQVAIKLDCKGTDWTKATNVVSGGPFLVRGGKAYVPYQAEGFTDGFAKNRHPRTAIGRTKEGDIWLVALDGRQVASRGATLSETADAMLRLGCLDAVNLDGGGSTTLSVFGTTVNRPSEGTERPVANAIVVFSALRQELALPVGGPQPVIAGPAVVEVGKSGQYELVDESGQHVPHTEVVWSAQGSGWVDQAGVLHGLAEGTCRMTGASGERAATLTVTVAKGPIGALLRN